MWTEVGFGALALLVAAPSIIAAWAGGELRRCRQLLTAAQQVASSRARSLSLASQELRGPSLALMAQASAATGGPSESHLAQMALHLLRLSDDMAHLASEPARRTLQEAPMPMGPVIDAAVALVAVQLRPAQRHWKIDPALRHMKVRTDSRALEGALAALLRRAAQHSRDGDVVAVRLELSPETLAIVVEDEGDGLPAQDLATAAASPIEGIPIGTANGTRGLDVGLTLARSLAAAHGGDIRLESAPGIGARAWLTLPRARLLQPG
jgi:signal transduction histidine kinase